MIAPWVSGYRLFKQVVMGEAIAFPALIQATSATYGGIGGMNFFLEGGPWPLPSCCCQQTIERATIYWNATIVGLLALVLAGWSTPAGCEGRQQ